MQQQKRQIRSQSNTISKSQLTNGHSNLSINVNLEKNGYIDQSRDKFNKEGERLDEEFNQIIQLIESALVKFNKHEKIRIEQWIKKLCQVTSNLVWKQNRNLYVKVLQDMVSNTTMYEPFTKVPPEGPLPRLTKFDIPYHARSIIRDFEKENENFNFDKLTFQNHSPSKFGHANLKNMRDKSNDRLRGNSSNSKVGSYLSINNNNNNNNNSSVQYGSNNGNPLTNIAQNQNSTGNLSSVPPTLNKIPLPHSSSNMSNQQLNFTNQVKSYIDNSCNHSSHSLVSGGRNNNNNSSLGNDISNAIQRQSNLDSNSNKSFTQINGSKSNGICETCKVFSHQKEDVKSPQLQEKHQTLLNTVNSIFAEKRPLSGNKNNNNSSNISVNTNLLSDNKNYLNCQPSDMKRQPSSDSYQQSSYKRSGSCSGSTSYQKGELSGNPTYQLPLQNINLLKKDSYSQNSQNENLHDGLNKDSSSSLNDQKQTVSGQQNTKSNISQFQYSQSNNSQSTISDSKHLQAPLGNYNTERQSHESLSGYKKQQQPPLYSAYNSIDNSSKNSIIESQQGGNVKQNFLVKDYLSQVDSLQKQLEKEKEVNNQLQMEIDLLKLSENDLKKENNLKQTHINQLTKNNEKLKIENSQYRERHINFTAVLQKVSKYLQIHEDTMQDDLEYQYLLKELEMIQQKTSESMLLTSPTSITENRNHLKKKKRTELDSNYQQYAENIKQKLQQTNEGTNEFLSYLNRIKKNLD